jgi:20S proteasome subunit alpha 6
MSIGARSQSAKTYLEKHYKSFTEGTDKSLHIQIESFQKISHFRCRKASLDELIKHGLHALRDTLQQDKEINTLNCSIGIVGAGQKFYTIEDDSLQPYLNLMDNAGTADDAAEGEAPMDTE